MNRAEIKRILRWDDRGMALWALHHILKLEKENRRLRQTVTALRTPHGLPGEEELAIALWKDDPRPGQRAATWDAETPARKQRERDKARRILSRLTANKEDGKNG